MPPRPRSARFRLRRGFDHQRSALVDVVDNAEGQFVQVWSSPRGTEGRALMLTYQRGPDGITECSSIIELSGTDWRKANVSGDRRTFYREGSRDTRVEWSLPSGRWLVSDAVGGFEHRVRFHARFDPETRRPKGRALGDRAVMKRQREDQEWFKLHFQRAGESEQLVLVESHRGRSLERVWEYADGELTAEVDYTAWLGAESTSREA